MPFTLAHPAVVLPLRRWLPLPALVAGSLAPDLPYYLRHAIPRFLHPELAHTPIGLVGIDLLMGFALLAAGRAMAAPVMALAPLGWRVRVPRPGRPAVGLWWLAPSVAGVLVGAVTHLLWDQITHADGAAVQAWAWLRTPVLGPNALFNVLSYLSAAVGIAVLLWWARRWYRGAPVEAVAWQAVPGGVRGAVAVCCVLAAAIGVGLTAAELASESDQTSYDVVRNVIIGAAQGTATALVAYAALWYARRSVSRAGPR
ncbi:DUF4184 family protein [Pseudonocardia sp. GCM10023141]|uniref:DUF4184 family protein n=1 Tax=Pseudonocardia sp. GCM10023141 TaxID=3252653 RepID=UPI00361A65A4